VAGWLSDNAPDLFDTKTSARKWIENRIRSGDKDGIFRIQGQRGQSSRFVMAPDHPDPERRLTELFGPLADYKGPERAIVDAGVQRRLLTDHPELAWFTEGGYAPGPFKLRSNNENAPYMFMIYEIE